MSCTMSQMCEMGVCDRKVLKVKKKKNKTIVRVLRKKEYIVSEHWSLNINFHCRILNLRFFHSGF